MVKEIKDLCRERTVTFVHAFCEAKMVADTLAKHGQSMEEDFEFFLLFPNFYLRICWLTGLESLRLMILIWGLRAPGLCIKKIKNKNRCTYAGYSVTIESHGCKRENPRACGVLVRKREARVLTRFCGPILFQQRQL